VLTSQFWDPRKKGDAVRSYTQHWDYISDFLYFEDKRQLVATSGDGHLSVIDVRSNKAEPLHVSANQEDELLSIVPINGGAKCVVGTGLGVLTIWNRKLGWDDSIDRFIGHPASIDALVPLTEDVVATGSEDGLVRVVNISPNRFRKWHCDAKSGIG
jgi:WD40 repeat protein